MMGRERADLGFGADDGFDPDEWRVGEAGQGGRQPAPANPAPAPAAAPAPARPRRRRTGRNAQFNLKARPDTIAHFCAVADKKGWGLGETLEHAVALLEREYGSDDPTRNG